MSEVEFYIEKLFNYFNVSTISELAKLLNTQQSSISSWRNRNALAPIKKKCRELGIYNNIFGELNDFSNSTYSLNNHSSLIDNSQNKTISNNYSIIPKNLILELSTLFSRVNDESIKKDISYKIEDFIIELKKDLRD